ncbi:MAG: hypothetical protein EXS10_10215 [Phycisphaerales bacterium]|nr:hypothetical protein [Phycisphaerales bacterium]
MAKFFPSTPDPTAPHGELVFRAQLEAALTDIDVEVYCGLTFSVPQRATTREIDFLVVDDHRGILSIEVKGGPYGFDAVSGRWGWFRHNGFSSDSKGAYEQSLSATHTLMRVLCKRFAWTDNDPRIRFRALVGLPESDPVAFPSGMGEDDFLCARIAMDPAKLRDALETQFAALSKRFADLTAGHANTVAAVRRAWLRPHAVPRIRIVAEIERDRSLESDLVSPAIHVIDAARDHARVLLEGAAGTGKTFAAVRRALRERARLTALHPSRAPRVLVTCYNRFLAESIARKMLPNEAHITCVHFHQLAEDTLRATKHWPTLDALEGTARFDAMEAQLTALVQTGAGALPKFDAVVIDEAQDFKPAWIDCVLDGFLAEDGTACAFRDSAQGIYDHEDPAHLRRRFGEPFLLTRNLRNSRNIASFLDRFGLTQTSEDALPHESREGRVPRVEQYPTGDEGTRKQLQLLDQFLTELLSSEDVRPRDIVLLSPFRRERTCLAGLKSLCGMELMRASEYPLDRDPDEFLRYETLHTFKGAESAVVILHDVQGTGVNVSPRALYTACSRATNALYVLHREDARV